MRGREHGEAVAFMQWWAYWSNGKGIPQFALMAIPNQGRAGGGFQRFKGYKMKLEGLRAGVPDYLLAIPRKPYHGLFIELKSEEGKLTAPQKEMLALLSGQSYKCVTAFGTQQAMDTIIGYLKLPRWEAGNDAIIEPCEIPNSHRAA